MEYNFTYNTKTIKNIYDAFNQGQLIIDNSYQRRKVWIEKDKVRLIETILLNFIIPEIFVWDSSVDPDTGNTITHIVDGQQRISAISEFLSNEFNLSVNYLMEDTIKNLFGGKYFKDLPSEIRAKFWSYKLSIIEIDPNCNRDDITKLFYRLNLTNYSLNEQERRNSLSSRFGKTAEKLADNSFWSNFKIFSSNDYRRMKDIEFTSNILILLKEGILDQPNQEKINQVYETYLTKYDDADKDMETVHQAMELIIKFDNSDTHPFLSKKIQMYSMFSLMFDFISHNIEINDNMIQYLTNFAKAYNKFTNGIDFNSKNLTANVIFDEIKKYKLASSEGVNKFSNRMMRFKILKEICTNKYTNQNESLEEIYTFLKDNNKNDSKEEDNLQTSLFESEYPYYMDDQPDY